MLMFRHIPGIKARKKSNIHIPNTVNPTFAMILTGGLYFVAMRTMRALRGEAKACAKNITIFSFGEATLTRNRNRHMMNIVRGR